MNYLSHRLCGKAVIYLNVFPYSLSLRVYRNVGRNNDFCQIDGIDFHDVSPTVCEAIIRDHREKGLHMAKLLDVMFVEEDENGHWKEHWPDGKTVIEKPPEGVWP